MTIKISQLATLSTLSEGTFIPVIDTTGTYTSKKIEASTIRTFLANIATSADTANLSINSSLIPTATGEYDLGSGSLRYGNVFLTGATFTSGNILNTSAIQSASTTTGAIIVTGGGGVGVTGNINAGNVNATYIGGTLLTTAQPYVTSVGTLAGLTVSAAITANANVTLNLGSTSAWWNIVYARSGVFSSNVITTNLTGTLLTNAQPNITSVGNLSSLSASGTIQTTGNVSATKLIGDGSLITNIATSSFGTITTLTATGNVSAGNLSATYITGTLLTSAQPNITSVGNLASVTTSSTVSAIGQVRANSGIASTNTTTGALTVIGGVGATGNLNVGGLASVTGNLTAGNVSATNLTGTLQTASQTNITSVGTLGTLAVTGNVTTGNVSGTYLTGTLLTASQTNITSVGTLGTLAVTGNVTTGNVSGTYLTGTLLTAAQTRITSVGTLTALTVSGNITAQGNVTVSDWLELNSDNNPIAIVNKGTAGVGNIGASGQGFNTAFVKATSAQYADLAELYQADADYAPGTVLEFGGVYEVTLAQDGTPRVAGVVSTNPAHIMNTRLTGKHVVAVALQGRVPCRVRGTIHKGDMLVSAGDGFARPATSFQFGTIIGKALQNFDGEGVIEVVVGRL